MKSSTAALFLVLTACAGSREAPAPKSSMEVAHAEYGRRLVAKAASCWTGGMWGDALGEQGDARSAGVDKRCSSLLDEIGETPEQSYASLRAVDARVVIRLEAKLKTHGAAELVPLFHAVAEAAREDLHARYAADAVKRDYGDKLLVDRRHADKVAAAAPLRESHALGALLHYDGPDADDGRTIGVLLALDRMQIAHGLPMHLKVYAVGGALHEVFGVEPPEVSSDAAAPIKGGTWLGYLTRVADAAGHPVPAEERDLFDRETFAWTGVLAGFSDKLKKPGASRPLADVTAAIAARLEDEHAGARSVSSSLKARR